MQRIRFAMGTIRRAAAFLASTASLVMLLGLAAQPVNANPEAVAHDFPDPAVLNDGSNPYGALVQDTQTGIFYGTTRFGGKYGKGTVYSMTPSFVVTILHSFSGPDGANPTSTLILVSSPTTAIGTLYGTTQRGGKQTSAAPTSQGTVFKIATSGAGFSVLHSFLGAPNDGANPYAGVILASDGKLYGTTVRGGKFNLGTTYRLKVTGGATTITHNFSGITPGAPLDGAEPYARLFEFKPGELVGTTVVGGDADKGIVFTEALSGAPYAMIHTFVGGNDGANPTAELIQVMDVTGLPLLYGTTVNGGANSGGTAYRLDSSGGSYSVIYSFGSPGDAANPWAGLFYLSSTNLIYGSSRNGGSVGMGAVFELTPASPAAEAVIHSFDPFGPVVDGANPVAALIYNPLDGLLYSTCTEQGANFGGTVYQIGP